MRLFANIGHRIKGESHIEAKFVSLARGCLDAARRCHSGYHDLGHTHCLELGFQIGCCERTPTALRNNNVGRLLP